MGKQQLLGRNLPECQQLLEVLGEVLQGIEPGKHIDQAGLGDRLAALGRYQSGQLILLRQHDLHPAAQNARPFSHRSSRPRGISLLGSGDGIDGPVLVQSRHPADLGLGRRIDRGDHARPRAVDVANNAVLENFHPGIIPRCGMNKE